mmetsp:Transcript_27356/g.50419  ORF Transcript_27356/g.50419 Transcript_27356/m.50419 type:complete len:264 (-) Transcript_27356:361-1152(-)
MMLGAAVALLVAMLSSMRYSSSSSRRSISSSVSDDALALLLFASSSTTSVVSSKISTTPSLSSSLGCFFTGSSTADMELKLSGCNFGFSTTPSSDLRLTPPSFSLSSLTASTSVTTSRVGSFMENANRVQSPILDPTNTNPLAWIFGPDLLSFDFTDSAFSSFFGDTRLIIFTFRKIATNTLKMTPPSHHRNTRCHAQSTHPMSQRKQTHEHLRIPKVQFQRMQRSISQTNQCHLVRNKVYARSIELKCERGKRTGIGFQMHQ